MKKIKLISFTIICTMVIQILMPILIDIDWNIVYAENNTNTWDVSAKEDGSVIAELSEDGTLTISGSGSMKSWLYESTTDWHSSENKKKIKNVIINNNITSIGNEAFYGCRSLTSITIPEVVTSIGYSAFEGCSSLTSINVSGNNQNFVSEEGVLYTKDKTELIQYPAGKKETKYIIPEGVTSIRKGAFYGCSSLTSITIPEGVTSIGSYAFLYCYHITIYCTSKSYSKEYAIANNIKYTVDDQYPTIISVTGNENWKKNEITLTINAEDNQSGLSKKAYSFDNGQTWQSENKKTYTENTKGIIIKVRDALGNIATYNEINVDKIYKLEIKDYIEITKEEENYLTRISQNTTISQLKEKIETNAPIKITKGEQEITDENALVETGMDLQIGDTTYTLVVTGDLNGDGKIGLTDLANLKLSIVGKRTLSTASTLAGDVNGDGKTSLSDLAKLKMYLVGKITI